MLNMCILSHASRKQIYQLLDQIVSVS